VADHDVTGVLLVGGASRRFGSPKALAPIDGTTLAERAHATLAAAFPRVLVVGKHADALPLPFPVLDDGRDARAAIVGVAAALAHADTELCVVLPTDMPFVTAELLRTLAAAARESGADAATFASGPLPAALRVTSRSLFERRLAEGDLALHRALAELETVTVQADEELLRNVNPRGDLARRRSG
jgi:molybdopterin-guanine dinucleotide biosynthesis protein A